MTGQTPEVDSQKSTKASVLSYVFLPGIIPQVKELTRGGFGYFALLIANIYQVVRILPANHPYTKYENLGKFGLRAVVAEAANNVQVNKKNIDQIIIFMAVLAGILILALQIISFLILLFSGEAFAAGVTSPDDAGGIFSTPVANQSKDIAFHMMREVFGIPDMFGPLPNGPTAFHKGLHAMLQFYNLALLVVAVLVFVYYVIVVVAETAESGTPFGQRFSHIYAPFRLVIAIGLLVPLNYGLNGAQWVTLYAAKAGSGFATTGWVEFNNSIKANGGGTANPMGAESTTLIAETNAPDIHGLVEFMATVATCREAYALAEETGSIAKEIKGFIPFTTEGTDGIKITTPLPLDTSTYDTLKAAENTEDITIVFGTINAAGPTDYSRNSQHPGGIFPYCGRVVVPITVPMTETSFNGKPGDLQQWYFDFVTFLWDDTDLKEMGEKFARIHLISDAGTAGLNNYPDRAKRTSVLSEYKALMDASIIQHYIAARADIDADIRDETLALGWGGAGIWYNRIAQINGAYVVTTMNSPAGQKYPSVMENVLEQKKKQDSKFSGCKAFEPNLSNDKPVYLSPKDQKYAAIFNAVHQYWNCDKPKNASNFFIDAMNAIFGTGGLMAIRDSVTTTDADGNEKEVQIHPLAKLSALGRSLVESAIRNMGMAIGASFFGGLGGGLDPQIGQTLGAASSMFVSIATIGLSIGFITYYILPFLPFIYFFFAVGGWVKGIFEAMVGAPLWALAHLRIDGDGLPGKAAMSGYLLIFEIFLRPILTIFGLIGGIAIFSALAALLNEIFDLVVLNTAQVDLKDDQDGAQFGRHVIDIFFFTCVYAIVLYMMAVSSFKMINLVPNNILRWLGQSVAAFNDSADDPAGNLSQYAALAGNQIGGKLAGGLTQLSQGVGSVGGGLIQATRDSGATGGKP